VIGRYGKVRNKEGIELVNNVPKIEGKRGSDFWPRMLHFLSYTATQATVKMKLEKRRIIWRTVREAKEAAEMHKAAKNDITKKRCKTVPVPIKCRLFINRANRILRGWYRLLGLVLVKLQV